LLTVGSAVEAAIVVFDTASVEGDLFRATYLTEHLQRQV
jgi:hypothetical protein